MRHQYNKLNTTNRTASIAKYTGRHIQRQMHFSFLADDPLAAYLNFLDMYQNRKSNDM